MFTDGSFSFLSLFLPSLSLSLSLFMLTGGQSDGQTVPQRGVFSASSLSLLSFVSLGSQLLLPLFSACSLSLVSSALLYLLYALGYSPRMRTHR
jgi:hypothetical protein